MRQVFVFFIVFTSFQLLHADPASDEAIRQTQSLLTDRSQRNDIIAKDAKAKSVDDNVNSLMGGNSESLYQSSASDFLPYILKLADGDPAKAQAILQEASQNPQKFLESLPSDLKGKVGDLADKSAVKQKNP